jgi:hypothetical protein
MAEHIDKQWTDRKPSLLRNGLNFIQNAFTSRIQALRDTNP